MAVSASTVWEVRTAGNDTNGGGFVTGASGTDYSQQDAKNTGANDVSTTDAVAAGTTTITSLTANFGTTIVGNILYFAGGTGSIAGVWRQCTARASATSITIDAAIAASTGMTMNIGGALLTPQTAIDRMTVADMTTYIKAGTYNLTTALTTPSVSPTNYDSRIIGYNATRGDTPTGSGRPTLATNEHSINAITNAQQGFNIQNLILDGSGTTKGLVGYAVSANYNVMYNCKITGFTNQGVNQSAGTIARVSACEVTACGSGINMLGGGDVIEDSFIHDNAGVGVTITNQTIVRRCVITNNTGASSDGVLAATSSGFTVVNCTIHGNGRDGIRDVSTVYATIGTKVADNIITSNAGYGINFSTAPAHLFPNINYNAFRSNTSGAVNGISAGTNDVTLTADPYTTVGSNDFSLNTTAGGGAACRAAGFPGVFPGATATGNLDMGAVQHADPASGGGLLTHPGMSGGMRG